MIPTPAEAFLADVAVARSRPRGALACERVFVKLKIHSGSAVTLERIRAEHRGHGDGSSALRKLSEIADRHGVALHLFAIADYDAGLRAPRDPQAQTRLTNWYRREGYVPADGDVLANAAYLIRPPRGADILARPEAAFAAVRRTDPHGIAARDRLAAIYGADDADAAVALLAEVAQAA